MLEVDLVEVPDRLRRSLANYVGARDVSSGEEVRRLRDLAAAARGWRRRLPRRLRNLGAEVVFHDPQVSCDAKSI